MNILITIISIILFLVLSIIIYNGLQGIDSKKKIIILLSESFICFVFTIILFNISSIGIEYPSNEAKKISMRILVAIFTPINGIILLPNITRLITKSKSGEIDKEECKKRLKKFLIIFLLLIIIEFNYLKNIQIGILNNYNI